MAGDPKSSWRLLAEVRWVAKKGVAEKGVKMSNEGTYRGLMNSGD